MRLYIAGPMRGYPLYNFKAFFAAALQLRELGHTIVNPAEIDMADGLNPALPLDHADQIPFDMGAVLKNDFAQILASDGLVLLPGWEASTGANAERVVAHFSGRKIFTYDSMVVGAMRDCDMKPNIYFGEVDETPRLWEALPGVKQLRMSLVDISVPVDGGGPDGKVTVHVDVVDSESGEQVYDFGPRELGNGGQQLLIKLDAEVELDQEVTV